MGHLPKLITDLALILAAAGVITLLFKILKQPVVLGYIIAGLLVGPKITLFPTIVDVESIRTWADIGVIFLLFSLGLEFSFKKLIKVGNVAVVTALIEISFTMLLGFLIGKLMGWGMTDSLFMGGMLAIASTTIIIRAFDELGMKSQKFAGIVMGILVVEDLVAVVLMVLLSTVALSQHFAGDQMLGSALKLVFFLVLWFVAGIFFLPSLLKAIHKYLSDETMLIVSLALCFMMVMLATEAGFSPALGAFIMGSILAETTYAEKIDHLVKSVKDLFGAIFFVSVGMLIDPHILLEYAPTIAISAAVLIFGKPLFVTSGALLTGQSLKTSVQAGMSLSQIGEFSFIIATLGQSLNVTSDFLYPVAVAVSVVTTFTTPYMIRLSEPTFKGLEKLLPAKWINTLNVYSAGAQHISHVSDWKTVIRSYAIHVVIYSVIIITLILLATNFLAVWLEGFGWNHIAVAIITLALLTPFLWALAFGRSQKEAYATIWKRPNQRGPLVVLQLTKVALAIFYTGFLLDRLFSPLVALFGALILFAIILVLSKRIQAFYGRIELRFLSNLNERESIQNQNQALAPWDTHLANFELNVHTPYIGKTLLESKIREEFGVNIALIERDDVIINVPSRYERLYPRDVISVIGTDEQLKHFKEHLESFPKSAPFPSTGKQDVQLQQMVVGSQSLLLGKTIRDSGIRERAKGLVVGIERQGKRILNPESDLVFETDDVVWIVGSEKRIQVIAKECERGVF